MQTKVQIGAQVLVAMDIVIIVVAFARHWWLNRGGRAWCKKNKG